MLSELYIRSIAIEEDKLSADSYTRALPAVRGLLSRGALSFTRPVTFFIGENGAGKSTLLEAMAVAYGFNPEGGSRNFSFATCETHADLGRAMRLGKGVRRAKTGFFLRAESFYNVATQIDGLGMDILGAYGGVSLHRQSHGESFMALVGNRFGPEGLYLLDEPEAALSPTRQMGLLVYLDELVAAGCQFVIATHSPILMAYPGAEILLLEGGRIERTDYRETEHYRVTREFLQNPDRMLRILLDR